MLQRYFLSTEFLWHEEEFLCLESRSLLCSLMSIWKLCLLLLKKQTRLSSICSFTSPCDRHACPLSGSPVLRQTRQKVSAPRRRRYQQEKQHHFSGLESSHSSRSVRKKSWSLTVRKICSLTSLRRSSELSSTITGAPSSSTQMTSRDKLRP